MADVEQLNFKLIINDEDFKQKIKEVETAAQQLNTNVSSLLNLQKQLSVVSDEDVENAKRANKIKEEGIKLLEKEKRLKMATENKAFKQSQDEEVKRAETQRKITQEREKEAQAVIKTATQQEKLNKLQEQSHKSISASSRLWREVGALATAYFSVAGAERLVRSLVQTTAEFEKQRISLRAILGDLKGADAIFEQIKSLAVMSPFQFKELVTYTKQLSAYSIPMEELYNTTKMLADVSAGLGVGMDRLVLAYGQIRSASFLRGLSHPGLSASEDVKNTNSLNCWNLSSETISSQAPAFA